MPPIQSRKHGRTPFQIGKPPGIASLLAGGVLALPAAAQVASPDGGDSTAPGPWTRSYGGGLPA